MDFLHPEAQRFPNLPVDIRKNPLDGIMGIGSGVPRKLDQLKAELVICCVKCAVESGIC
jgi:hypothetical protein